MNLSLTIFKFVTQATRVSPERTWHRLEVIKWWERIIHANITGQVMCDLCFLFTSHLSSDCYSEGGLCKSEEEGCACHEAKCHKIPEDVVMSSLCEVDRDCGLYFKCFLDREAGHCSCSQGTCQQERVKKHHHHHNESQSRKSFRKNCRKSKITHKVSGSGDAHHGKKKVDWKQKKKCVKKTKKSKHTLDEH